MGVGSARPSLLAHQVWNKAVCSATRRAVTVTMVLGRSAGGGAPRSQSQVSLILAHFASAVCTSPAPTTALARGAMCAYWRLRKGAPHAPQQTVTGFRTSTAAAPVASRHELTQKTATVAAPELGCASGLEYDAGLCYRP